MKPSFRDEALVRLVAVWRCLGLTPGSASSQPSTVAAKGSIVGLWYSGSGGGHGEQSPIAMYLLTLFLECPRDFRDLALGLPSAFSSLIFCWSRIDSVMSFHAFPAASLVEECCSAAGADSTSGAGCGAFPRRFTHLPHLGHRSHGNFVRHLQSAGLCRTCHLGLISSVLREGCALSARSRMVSAPRSWWLTFPGPVAHFSWLRWLNFHCRFT